MGFIIGFILREISGIVLMCILQMIKKEKKGIQNEF